MATDTPPWEKYAAQQQKAPVDDTAAWASYAGTPNTPADTQAAPTVTRGGAAESMHRLGVLGRGLIEGPTSTVGMVGDALNTGINMAGGAIGHNPNLPMPSTAIQGAMDKVGLPRAENTTEKVVQGLASMYTGSRDPLMSAVTKGLAPAQRAPLSPRERAISEGQRMGYQVPPSEAQGGVIGNSLEGLSEKAPLYNDMSLNNQNVTNKIARKVVGLAPDTEITEENIHKAMDAVYTTGYGPIKNFGNITTGSVYRKALDKAITENHGNSSFPFSADVKRLVDAYRLPNFDSGDAIATIQRLRSQAYNHMLDPNVRGASQDIAKALENNIELNLQAQGKPAAEMLQQFRDARTQLAKQNVVLKAISPGTGDVSAFRIADNMKNKGENYLTDELANVARFAKNAPIVNGVPTRQSTPRITHPARNVLTALVAGALGGAAPAAAVASIPFAQAGLRQGLMSPMAQKMLGPHLDPGILAQLSHNPEIINAMPAAYAASGLYGPRK